MIHVYALHQTLSGESSVLNFLLGWCVISLGGTLLALRLIRNGKSSHCHSVETPEPLQTTPSNEGISLPPDAHGIRHRAEHSR